MDIEQELNKLSNNPALFASTIYNIGLTFIGAVALIFIIYGGYLILTSGGEPEKIKEGKSYIVYSIIGLLLALAGFIFYQTIAQTVLGIPGFK